MVCTLVPTGWKGFIYEHCSSSERVTVTGVWVDMMRVEDGGEIKLIWVLTE